MSRRPGIGKEWYDKWKGDTFPSDNLIMRGIKMKPPDFYTKQLEKEDPELYKKIKKLRRKGFSPYDKEQHLQRLGEKHKVKVAQFKQLKRSIEG